MIVNIKTNLKKDTDNDDLLNLISLNPMLQNLMKLNDSSVQESIGSLNSQRELFNIKSMNAYSTKFIKDLLKSKTIKPFVDHNLKYRRNIKNDDDSYYRSLGYAYIELVIKKGLINIESLIDLYIILYQKVE